MEHGRSRQSRRNRSKGMCFLLAVFVSSVFLLPAGTAQAVDLKVGGYVKLDTMWSDKIAAGGGALELTTPPGLIALDSNKAADHSSFRMDARESRFNITATQEVGGVKLKGFLETDFYGDFSSSLLRLRHAYARADMPSAYFFIAGQTWSNFMDIELFPDLIDFNGPAGMLFARNPQVRLGYTAADLTVTASVEENKFNGSTTGGNGGQGLPIFTAKTVWAPKYATIEGAVAVGRNRFNFSDGTEKSKSAWGAMADASVPIGHLTVQGHFQYIDGLGRLANGDFGDAALVDNAVENVKTMGFWAGAVYNATADTKVYGYYGYAKAKDNKAANPGDEKIQSIHVGAMRTIYVNWRVGLEYEMMKREEFAVAGVRDEGRLNRIHGALWYFF